MSDLDEILQRKLEAIEDGSPPRKVVKGLKDDSVELEPLITLVAAIRDLPQPALSPETSRLMQKELITAARETLKLPSRKPAPSLAWLFTPGFASLSLVILLLGIIFFGGRAWLAGPSAAQTVLLYEVSGQVEVAENAKSDWQPASSGVTLRSGQLIRTQADSSAVLQYFDGTQTELAPNTELQLEEIGGGWGNVLKVSLVQPYGFTSHQVVPFGERKSSFAVNTLAGSASVHGTIFSAASEPNGKAYFAVQTGQVVVENDKGQVTLTPGQATTVQVDQAPEPPAYAFNLTDTLVLADGDTWWIGGVPFTLTSDTLLLDEFQQGDTVVVTGRILGDGRWIIDSIQPTQASPKKSMFAGVVQDMGDEAWLISGISVQVNLATRILDDVQFGNVVKVRYVVLENGSWQALEISTLVAGIIPPTPTPTPTSTPAPTSTPTPTSISNLPSSLMPTEMLLPAEFDIPVPTKTIECSSVESQPEAATLAERYSVPIGEIMGWFCQGYGFGEIDQVYLLRSESITAEAIFTLRASGLSMGAIKEIVAAQEAEKIQSVKTVKPANENKPVKDKETEKDTKPAKDPKP
jgi:hypothetical protein